MSEISVIGLGAMGSALTGAFIDRGHRTTVWNRSAAKAGPLVAKGAVLAGTVAEAIAASPLAIVCVLDYRAAREILEPVGNHLSGRALVNLTNGTPEDARCMARWAEGQGVRYLDGGIMAVPSMVGAPDALLLYSGSAQVFDAHRRELEGLGAARFLGTDAGLAALFDLALLSAMYGLFGGFLQSAALVGSENVKAAEFVTLAVPWLEAMTEALPDMARQIDARDYTKDVASNLAMQAVAVDNIVAASRAQGVGVDLIRPVRDLMARRIADGFGAEDVAGLIELIRSRPT